ncbi:hypothetical protein LTR64_003011 [Lithohypha guttulata]|uniref:Uncharacterized protein n=1 Tax=Lithohypha guttulata TaxID=1690604 RepID=A0AAN7YHA7_9EURO|nr:hypothetical protein LTR51_000765 [Lithohypha guttulata]KAK5085950.1 hypothetical protein LTR05_005240 [Lithohypha guttulata]
MDASKYTLKLRGQRVLIVGGSSGLGFAAAEASIENGASVLISSSSQQKVDKAVERLQQAYPSAKDRVSGYACNLSDQAGLEKNVVDLLEKAGTLDHIIHSAGDPLSIKPLAEITIDMAIQASMVRFYAPLMIGKHAAKYMNPGPRSSITLTTGGIIDRPMPNWILPGTTMCAVDGLMRGLALDLAPIRVNIVNPGAVETELWNHMSKEEFKKLKEHTEKNVPTGRLGQPEDVAEAYLYLMKDMNVTGISIRTQSGSLLK